VWYTESNQIYQTVLHSVGSCADRAGGKPGQGASRVAQQQEANASRQGEQWVHINGTLVPKSQAHLAIYDHGFLYGDGAFEGIRVYNRNIFRLKAHLARLYRSVHALGFSLPVDVQCMEEAVVETVRANGLDSGYIRLTVSRGVGLGLDPSHLKGEATVVISTEQLRLYPQEMYERGLDVITASTRVPPSVCIDPQIKTTGRYVNNIAAKMEANRVGAGEALMLNMQGNVAEATGDNIFLVSGGEMTTPPTSEGALPGITRAVVMDLAKEMGIPCRQCVTTLYDVYNADEAFLTGTAAEVIPMVTCDGRAIGDGRAGKTTIAIISAFRSITDRDGVRV
jgi:branched-chain amino acid aminotransferase